MIRSAATALPSAMNLFLDTFLLSISLVAKSVATSPVAVG
jgi:hypothetical protein